MLMNYLPEFHGIKAVEETDESGCYICIIDATIEGDREDVRYCSRASDPFGLAPQVRAALEEWLASGKPVTTP